MLTCWTGNGRWEIVGVLKDGILPLLSLAWVRFEKLVDIVLGHLSIVLGGSEVVVFHELDNLYH